VVAIAIVLMLIVILWHFFSSYNQHRVDQYRALQKRNPDGLRDVEYKRRHLRKLRQLKPKLKTIEKRLRREFGSEVRMELVISSETEDGKIIFKAEKLFDTLDRDGLGELTYVEINSVLNLGKAQLREFAARMNEAAGEPPETEEVERHVFVTQFLRIFDIVAQMDPSPEDAALMFDEIAKQGVTKNGEIPHRLFYTSPLAEFLKDTQINALLKGFQRTKEFHEGEDDLQLADVDNSSSGKRRGKDKALRQKRVPVVYRRSVLGIPERGGTISRNEFIARYPKLLADATKTGGRDPSSLFTSQLSLYKGIDVTFHKLSVSVKARDRSVRILHNITGRVSAGTMHAIMGGQDAGKTSLLYALSGRTFYGEVTGEIKINGHNTTLAEHATCVGFVPKVSAQTLWPL